MSGPPADWTPDEAERRIRKRAADVGVKPSETIKDARVAAGRCAMCGHLLDDEDDDDACPVCGVAL